MHTQIDDGNLMRIIKDEGLDHAIGLLAGRHKELRLFAVWCARQVQHLMLNQESINSMDLAEKYANGQTTKGELRKAWQESLLVSMDENSMALRLPMKVTGWNVVTKNWKTPLIAIKKVFRTWNANLLMEQAREAAAESANNASFMNSDSVAACCAASRALRALSLAAAAEAELSGRNTEKEAKRINDLARKKQEEEFCLLIAI